MGTSSSRTTRTSRSTWTTRTTRTTWATRCPSFTTTTSQPSSFHESCTSPCPMRTTTTTTTPSSTTTTTTMCPSTTTTMWMLWKEIDCSFKTLRGENMSVFDLVLTAYGTKEEYFDYLAPRQICMECCNHAAGYEFK